jgi:Tol biopolymer transport system component
MPATGGLPLQLSHAVKANAGEPVWSPDGRKIAFQEQVNGNYEIFVINANGTGTRQLTTVAYDNTDPAWSPSGRQIAFLTTRDGGSDIYVMNVDGSGQRRLG